MGVMKQIFTDVEIETQWMWAGVPEERKTALLFFLSGKELTIKRLQWENAVYVAKLKELGVNPETLKTEAAKGFSRE